MENRIRTRLISSIMLTFFLVLVYMVVVIPLGIIYSIVSALRNIVQVSNKNTLYIKAKSWDRSEMKKQY